jgi:transposase-like protein
MSSTVTATPQLSDAARAAIIAAVAAGQTQAQVAKAFGVHRNTVYMLCKRVREDFQHPQNPLALDYKASLRVQAIRAVESGLKDKRDRYKQAAIGVKVLEGIGDFVSGHQVQVDGAVDVIFQWAAPQDPHIESTVQEAQLVESIEPAT